MESYLDENQLIKLVCKKLEQEKCIITQILKTTQKGVDIIAKKENGSACEYYIEVKGATSSLPTSNRFGKPYTSSQILDRVAKGIFTCIKLRITYPEINKQHVILAVPDTRLFRYYLEPIRLFLTSTNIEIWYIDIINN